MTEPTCAAAPAQPSHRGWSRALAVALFCVAVALLLTVDQVFESLHRALSAAEPLIARHPFVGAFAFVLLAAISAILAFFSSALLLPAAVYAWGNTVTFGLLWLGWMLGGIGTYALGRGLRGRQSRASKKSNQLDFYVQRVPGDATFALVMLLCLALPSELPGYLCGFLRVRLGTYVAALALAEFPYAVGAVLLGAGVVQRDIGVLLAFGLIGAALSLCALWMLHRRLDQLS